MTRLRGECLHRDDVIVETTAGLLEIPPLGGKETPAQPKLGTGEIASPVSLPGHPGLPEWPAYSMETRDTTIFDTTCHTECDSYGTERQIWDKSA